MLQTNEEIKQLLTEVKRIAIVGLSDKPERDSYHVAEYLLRHGYEVIPVNPMIDEVLGLKSYKSLKEIPEQVDVVDVFRKSDQVLPVAKEAVEIGAKVLWLQLDVINKEAANYAEEHGLKVVMDKCIKIEHSRLF